MTGVGKLSVVVLPWYATDVGVGHGLVSSSLQVRSETGETVGG